VPLGREPVQQILRPKTDTAQTNPLSRQLGAIGFILTKKPGKLSSLIPLFTIPMVAYSALVGIAASVVLLVAERQNKQNYFHIHVNTDLAVGLGAASGAVSTTPMAAQILLLFVFSRYDWHIYAGRFWLSSPSYQRDRLIDQATKYRISSRSINVGVLVVLIIASSFARAVLPTLYVANSLGVRSN
jgi:hypothetical protein